jgi:hypothetical protein
LEILYVYGGFFVNSQLNGAVFDVFMMALYLKLFK